LKNLCPKLAYCILTNNYVVCEDAGCAIYHQMIGTAMGTTFSIEYAITFMIWQDTPVVDDKRFSAYTSDLLATLPYKSKKDAVTPSVVIARRYDMVNFLDLDISLQMKGGQALESESFSTLTTRKRMLMPSYPSLLSMDA
jgi:hypothetical protein